MENITPTQKGGGRSDTYSSVTLADIALADAHYELAKTRLININEWQQIAGKRSAAFKLFDAHGQPKEGNICLHDHFRIDVPGPGPTAGDGFEWVQVVEMYEQNTGVQKTFQMTVQPVPSPLNQKEAVAHFFSDDASSTFIVAQHVKNVVAEVHGRNEMPNTESANIIDKVRNTVIASFGILGFSKMQWKQLTEAIIRNELE